jgi:hypothetical protein
MVAYPHYKDQGKHLLKQGGVMEKSPLKTGEHSLVFVYDPRQIV